MNLCDAGAMMLAVPIALMILGCVAMLSYIVWDALGTKGVALIVFVFSWLGLALYFMSTCH